MFEVVGYKFQLQLLQPIFSSISEIQRKRYFLTTIIVEFPITYKTSKLDQYSDFETNFDCSAMTGCLPPLSIGYIYFPPFSLKCELIRNTSQVSTAPTFSDLSCTKLPPKSSHTNNTCLSQQYSCFYLLNYDSG